ncbi:hypothetical protein GPECTOR_40g566 [Gonium pectorale]|uniref:Uncharacterized protein n=1 Tax=Gonium pectorale TaxID=33097 RepID=A0A150GAG0_GONPE|nr:hypothetical protein GPECTOR_40g566 [Gonium pectorale]|eukprot:KXZ46832.1 hypothetical protein GPECTOR_40g566 [Gonium pectorale]
MEDGTLESSTSGNDPELEPDVYPEVPEGTGRAAELQYLAAGLAHLAAAGVAAFAALSSPQLLLPVAAASDPLAGVLLGCLAAAYLRAAGVFMHLRYAAINQELLCWRHQRLAGLTALYGLVAAATQAFGPASPQLAGLQLLLGAASAAVVVSVGRSAWSVAPFLSWVVEEAEGSLAGLLAALWRAAKAAASSIAGLLLLATTGLSLYGFVHVALAGAPAAPALAGGWPGVPHEALEGWAVGLRRLVGAGLLLLAAQAAALLDFAGTVRRVPAGMELEAVKQDLLENLLYTRDPLAKYYMAHPATLIHLNIFFLAAAGLQAAFVAGAPAAGINVNWDAALWGPLYGTWVLPLLYGAAVLLTIDWLAVGQAIYGAVAWVGDGVLAFFNSFVWKFDWAENSRRR